MKLATFLANDGPRLGVVDSERQVIIDVAAASLAQTGHAHEPFRSMDALIAGGSEALSELANLTTDLDRVSTHAVPLAAAQLLAPLPVPTQIRDCSVFERHIVGGAVGMARLKARREGRDEPPLGDGSVPDVYRRQPIYYFSNRFSVVGPDAVVRWPHYSTEMDFELEIAAVIAKRGKDLTLSNAADHIFGYTIFNDFSARDQQSVEMAGWLGPTKGKSFDAGNAFGPWIVTPDELGDYRTLTVAVRVNGEEWVRSDMSGMLHGFEDMIAFISGDETLHPGEIIGSGTVGGCCGLEFGRLLSDGDVVELEVSRIGTLRNTVRAAPPR